MSFRYDILTLFPGLFEGFLQESLIGKARDNELLSVEMHNWRLFAQDKHSKVDDAPFGGGAGLVLKADVLARGLDAVRAAQPEPTPTVLLTPAGRPLNQQIIESWSKGPGLTLICGRYEGFDARFEASVDERISLGDYVLNGGEVAAMAIIEATARMRPGVIGNAASLGARTGTAAGGESHRAGLLEYPQYTRPRIWRGQSVPDVLLSGDHAQIAAWRQRAAQDRTRRYRPDLWHRHIQGEQSEEQ
ncbi:MAG TPA: tRNA (guanosine(37)-N1)-methyltransferase TrmD [Myxococcales bacterium]|nr:tRNA (guanosine(37)-N1)-methyltransferase TrmD [Myxococcales bacterium]HAN32654.1 tRNA (guanosine(37)-N1)-methyltransferase TrmD [Myxococcales bacterium]